MQGQWAGILEMLRADRRPAVRKNRYVILPIDFEEAWKVSSFLLMRHNPFSEIPDLKRRNDGFRLHANSHFSRALSNVETTLTNFVIISAHKSETVLIVLSADR